MQFYLNNYLKTGKNDSSVIAYLAVLDHLLEKAPEVGKTIIQELRDQRKTLKMIASENFCSLTVQLAMGNLLTDKYAEGFAFHRFYAGCDNIDHIEDLGKKSAEKLFGTDHAYIQPHSGADANLVAFWAILTEKVQIPEIAKLGKTKLEELTKDQLEKVRQALCNQCLMGLSLASGGHLSHGYLHNFSGKMMRSVSYDVDPKTGLLNYDHIRAIAKKEKPLILIAGYSAYPRLINFAKMREIADEVGAVLLVDMAHFAGLVAGGVLKGEEHPGPYAHILTSTTHKTLRGPRGGLVLCKKEFTESVNKGCPLVLGGPLGHVMAAKYVAFQEALEPSFSLYAEQIVKNAKALAEGLRKRGIDLLTNGTDNHLLMIDLTKLPINGRQGEIALRLAGITANRNMLPFDSEGPWYTKGLRLGTAALTTLGMKEKEMDLIAEVCSNILKGAVAGEKSRAQVTVKEELLKEAKQVVDSLLTQFPLYPKLMEI